MADLSDEQLDAIRLEAGARQRGATDTVRAIMRAAITADRALNAPAPSVGAEGLPELPPHKHSRNSGDFAPLFTADQMRAYALAALASRPAVDADKRDADRYRWLRANNSHHRHNSAWLASLTAVKSGPCDIFSADEVPALLDAEIDRRMARHPAQREVE